MSDASNRREDASAGEQPSYLLDLYKLAVEMADRISTRRGSANTFFFTLNAGLAAFVGVAPSSESRRLGLTAVVGAVLSITWWLLLRSYRDLNRAKFDVITRLEQRFDIRLFDEEWRVLRKDPVKWWRPRYAELGFVERVVPIVFFLIYLVLGLQVWLG